MLFKISGVVSLPQDTETDLQKDLTDILSSIGVIVENIPKSRHYWFIRTYGGLFFDVFAKNNAVAIGWDWEKDVDYDGSISKSMQEQYWNIISSGQYITIEPHDDKAVIEAARKVTETVKKPKTTNTRTARKKRRKFYHIFLPMLEVILTTLSNIRRFQKYCDLKSPSQ